MAAEEVKFDEVVEGELVKWDEKGKTVLGILKSYKEQATAKGDGHVYEVKTATGLVAFFAPSLLHKKLANVKLGSIVKIVYVETKKTGSGNDLKHFSVGTSPATEANMNALGLAVLSEVADDAKADEVKVEDVDF